MEAYNRYLGLKLIGRMVPPIKLPIPELEQKRQDLKLVAT